MTSGTHNSRRRLLASTGEIPDLGAFLDGTFGGRSFARYRRSAVLYSQGDPADSVIYLKEGKVKLTVLCPTGRHGTIAIVDQGKLLGEGCLASQSKRMETATAMADTSIVRIEKSAMMNLLQREPALVMRFLDYALARSILIEENLVDQLLNSSERRLARLLLCLSHFDTESEKPESVVPPISQKTLAEMIGTSRERVNFFLKQFRQKGYISYRDGIWVRRSLFSVLLRE
jgi:CRP-like cAMP-binding protein